MKLKNEDSSRYEKEEDEEKLRLNTLHNTICEIETNMNEWMNGQMNEDMK